MSCLRQLIFFVILLHFDFKIKKKFQALSYSCLDFSSRPSAVNILPFSHPSMVKSIDPFDVSIRDVSAVPSEPMTMLPRVLCIERLFTRPVGSWTWIRPLDVEKRTVTREELVVDKDRVEGEKRVEGTVRREVPRVETEGDVENLDTLSEEERRRRRERGDRF